MLGTYHIPPCVSVAAQILTRQILTLDPRKWPTVKQILQHPWLTQGEQYLPHDYGEAVPKHPDSKILTVMFNMSYDLHKTWISLARRKFNVAMATCLILGHQYKVFIPKNQGAGCMFQGKPVPLRVKPHPGPLDLFNSPVLPKRCPSEPALHTLPLPCEPPLPEEFPQSGQKHIRRARQPAIHFCYPPTRTPTPDLASQTDFGQCHANGKFWKQLTGRIATCVLELCCCMPCGSSKVVPM